MKRRVLIIAALLVPLFAVSKGGGHRERHEFPTGFNGWAVVVWGEPGYPPLPSEGGDLVLRFPADGIIITSTQEQFDNNLSGISFFVDAAGHRTGPAVVAFGTSGSMRRGGDKMNYSTHFVGSDARFQATPGDRIKTRFELLFDQMHPDRR